MLTFTDRATSQQATVRLRVESVEPPRRFAFRWDYPDGAVPDVSEHSKGWDIHLASLRDYVAASS
jgi:uncharacterized protein YndB with AHSA1/START domain